MFFFNIFIPVKNQIKVLQLAAALQFLRLWLTVYTVFHVPNHTLPYP